MNIPFTILTLLFMTIMSGGCASHPGNANYLSEPNLPIRGRIDKAPVETKASTLESDVLLFGKIRWIENGNERNEYRSGWGWNIWFPFYRMEDGESGLFVIEKDGLFFWRVPKGSYLIHRIEWRDAWDGLHFLNSKVAIDATKEEKALCLGTLTFDIQSSRNTIGGLVPKNIKGDVEDNCDALEQQFHTQYRDSGLKTSTSLMRFNPNLPIPENIKDMNRFKDIFRSLTPGLMSL